MKSKYIVLASAMMVSLSTFAQKDELKACKKIYAKEAPSATELQDYKSNVTKLETLASAEADKVYYNFYKAMLPIVELNSLGRNATPIQMMTLLSAPSVASMANGMNATLDYEKKSGKEIYTEDIQKTVGQLKPMLFNVIIQMDKAKKYKEASEMLYSIYLLDKKDGEKLYYAANYAVTAQDYDRAMAYYEELVKIKYTGEGTVYWAKNVASGAEEVFPDRVARANAIQLGVDVDPRDEKLLSKRGEILKTLTEIYIHKGKTEEAKKLITDARAANPDDVSLIVTEANMYLQTKDFVTYKKLVAQALEKDPNNAELYYNLGVISYDNQENAEAEKYYLKALAINPNHVNANLNLAVLKMVPEKKLVEQMNKLGTTPAENKKYDALKKQRDDMYRSAIPYLEKAVELDPKNEEASRTLLSVYKALEMTDKAKALKAKMEI